MLLPWSETECSASPQHTRQASARQRIYLVPPALPCLRRCAGAAPAAPRRTTPLHTPAQGALSPPMTLPCAPQPSRHRMHSRPALLASPASAPGLALPPPSRARVLSADTAPFAHATPTARMPLAVSQSRSPLCLCGRRHVHRPAPRRMRNAPARPRLVFSVSCAQRMLPTIAIIESCASGSGTKCLRVGGWEHRCGLLQR